MTAIANPDSKSRAIEIHFSHISVGAIKRLIKECDRDPFPTAPARVDKYRFGWKTEPTAVRIITGFTVVNATG